MMLRKLLFYWIVLSINLPFSYVAANDTTPIPSSCRQMILVLTDSVKATKGILYYFERDNNKVDWVLAHDKMPIVLGRSGLGWGIGLHNVPNISNFPIKQEGDGRSPAGVFRLSSVFGYKPPNEMRDLKMPYIYITEMIECIDDTNSQYYNQIVSRNTIGELEHIDWQSSEKMRLAGIYYELGVIVDHNRDPVDKAAGSCIFLHNWSNPNETMAGCTAMAPPKMKEIIYWLDKAKNPILVQLTRALYINLMKQWELPEIYKNANTKEQVLTK